jgi:hypothetical protein
LTPCHARETRDRALQERFELLTWCALIGAVGAPDYLLSSFVNGTGRLPCDFG